MIDFAVIGSGISGATISNKLKKKYSIKVFEKAKGVGGRSSFKRFKGKIGFDHGLQYLSPRSREFKSFTNKLINSPHNYGSSNKEKKKFLVEFVSANPTGPLHVGHCRGAILGDVISNILEFNQNIVEREYYVNDYGNQVSYFNYSVYLRIREK